MRLSIGRRAAFAIFAAALAAAAVVAVVARFHHGDDVRKDAQASTGGEEVHVVSNSGAVASSGESEAAVMEAARRPYDGSNVFVRLPSGVIVRQGESIPPPAEGADKAEESLRAALDEWDEVVKACSGGAGGGGRKVGYAEFSRALGRIPRRRRNENLKYAINMIDDENFVLVAALALDRSQPPELIATAFDACLNRECASSMAVIEEISRDKTHPMYVDAARVMDVRRLSGQ